MQDHLTPAAALPADGTSGTLIGRAWLPGDPPGPAVVAIRDDGVFDLGRAAPTVSELLNADDPVALARSEGTRIGDLAEILANSAYDRRDPGLPWLLAPCDLQAIKACGVTFATSMLERVIEEQARGDASKADAIRAMITDLIGTDLSKIVPGSDAAMRLKAHLIEQGAWSQYLEVGIGKDAEVFTKCPPMATVGTGSEIGVLSDSALEQPRAGAGAGDQRARADRRRQPRQRRQPARRRGPQRPAARQGQGQQRVLRDRPVHPPARREPRPRSAARDHDQPERAAARTASRCPARSSMAEISRDITDLAAQTIGANHQYPDGALLFTGTMFAPIQDRDHAGPGLHPQGGRPGGDRLSRARHADQPRRTIATGSRPGRSARAR